MRHKTSRQIVTTLSLLSLLLVAGLSPTWVVSTAFAAPGGTTVAIPYLSGGYKYQVVSHGTGGGFEAPAFDDSAFAAGTAAFGTGLIFGSADSCPLRANGVTFWSSNTDILVRKSFTLPAGAKNLTVGIAIDDDVQVFLNGVDISGGMQFHSGCASNDSFIFAAPDSLLLAGSNVLAVRGRDDGFQTYLDTQVTYSEPGSALQFNGRNQQVRVADAPALRLQTNLTLEAFAKPLAVPDRAGIAGKGSSYKLEVDPAAGGFSFLCMIDINGTWRMVNSATFALGRWYHAACTYDGATLRVFVDGQLSGSKAVTGKVFQTTAPFRIGTGEASGDFFNGLIDEVRLSNVVRYTAAFACPTAPFAPDAQTLALWHLDENMGATAADSSGNGRTGTLVNAPAWVTDTPFAP